MPTYTFPSTIYSGPVIIGGYKADVIECNVEPPMAPHPNLMRLIIKLSISSMGALPGGKLAVTIPNIDTWTLSLAQPVNIPTVNNVTKRGSTVAWDFVTTGLPHPAGNTIVQSYYLDFTSFPVVPAGSSVVSIIQVYSTSLVAAMSITYEFTPVI